MNGRRGPQMESTPVTGTVRSQPVSGTARGSILSRGVTSPDMGEYPVSARESRERTQRALVASRIIRWEGGLVPRAAFPDFMDGKTVNIVPQQTVVNQKGYRGDLPIRLQPIVRKPWPWLVGVVR